MRPNVLAQLMLCRAAVLFLPQALECCAHSSTVLEALANEAPHTVEASHHKTTLGTHTGISRSRTSTEQQEHAAERNSSLPNQMDPDDLRKRQVLPGLSLPVTHQHGQSPSLGALIISKTPSAEPGWRPYPLSRRVDSAIGRFDRPEIPPPRFAA